MAEEETQMQTTQDEMPYKPRFYENLLQFQSDVINPQAEKTFQFLTRDCDLGNIDKATMAWLVDKISFANELVEEGFNESAIIIYSEVISTLIMSRSVNGFQQTILATNIFQHLKTEQQSVKRAGGVGFLSRLNFRRR